MKKRSSPQPDALNAANPKVARLGRAKSRSDRTMPGRVLVVEDDAILAMAIEDALRDGGVDHVEISPSTERALEILREHQPDVIVLDVHLADREDGWTVAELVRSLGPSGPRVIFSTGAPGDIPHDIAEMGAIMEKPYDLQDLVEVIAEPRRRGIISRLRAALS